MLCPEPHCSDTQTPPDQAPLHTPLQTQGYRPQYKLELRLIPNSDLPFQKGKNPTTLTYKGEGGTNQDQTETFPPLLLVRGGPMKPGRDLQPSHTQGEGGGRGEKGTETSTPTPYHTKDLGGKRKRGQRTPLTGNYSIINCYPETVVLPLYPTTKFPTKLTLLHAPPKNQAFTTFTKSCKLWARK